MHRLYGALLVPCAPVRVTRGALIAHRYTPSVVGESRSSAELLSPMERVWQPCDRWMWNSGL